MSVFKIDTIQIETTDVCNNACKFCPHATMKCNGAMDMWLFKKIIDESAELGIRRIVPHLNGEPFADPLLFERLDYIREKIPNCYLELFSNGSLMTKEKVDKIKKYNIDFMNISVNAATKETYKEVVKRDHFDDVVKNAIYLIESKAVKHVRISMVPCPGAEKDVEKFKEFWSKYDCEVQVNDYYNWQGRIYKSSHTELKPCFRILNHLTINSQGKVIWCCMDIGDHIIGDLTKETIKEVWRKTEWRRIMHTQLKRMFLPPCDKCTS